MSNGINTTMCPYVYMHACFVHGKKKNKNVENNNKQMCQKVDVIYMRHKIEVRLMTKKKEWVS